MSTTTTLLGPDDVGVLRAILGVFAEAFDDRETYLGAPPDDAYLRGLLAGGSFLAVAAWADGAVVGGLAAYELRKFERRRSEVYIYDLAVAEAHRRKGLATAMIRALQAEAARRGAWLCFVQADYGDEPAVALYTKLGVREDVMHFDLPMPGEG